MLTIALKELTEALRDRRSLVSSVFYCLMGPGIVWLVASAMGHNQAVLAGMISVFSLVSAFSGGMNVAIDIVAGERERKSLVPLLANPVSRRDVILGKWLAVTFFSLAGMLLCLAAFNAVYAPDYRDFPVVLVTGVLPLCCLAGAIEVGLSTMCRSLKEAHTYLSMIVFLPMAIGMFGVFFPTNSLWYAMLPIAGHHLQLEQWLRHEQVGLLSSAFLGLATAFCSAVMLVGAGSVLEREEAVYGG